MAVINEPNNGSESAGKLLTEQLHKENLTPIFRISIQYRCHSEPNEIIQVYNFVHLYPSYYVHVYNSKNIIL